MKPFLALAALGALLAASPSSAGSATLPDLGPAPELRGGQAWLNSGPLTLEKLRGKVVLVEFWTSGCINCIRNAPFVQGLWEKYREKGLVVVGVHTPEFEHQKTLERVQQSLKELSIGFPVVQDNDYAIWNAFGNRYWPAGYFLDARGHIRFTHFGEGAHLESEAAVRALLLEAGVKL